MRRMTSSLLVRHLQPGLGRLPPGPLVVAFSGGLDSTALLHALAGIEAARERGLRAVHVDHGLQAESSAWAVSCATLAAQIGVALSAVTTEPASAAGRGVEGAARKARYRALRAAMHDGDILTTAQHADDQAETVMLKLLRGAGPEGLGGMRELRDFAPGRLWRPLLDLPRAVLKEHAQAHGLCWIEDPSNDDTRLRRNFLRREILPRIAQRWPDAPTAITHSARWAREAADYIDQAARDELGGLHGSDPATLDWRRWLDLAPALRDPVLRLWLRSLGLDEPAHFHVAELVRQLRGASGRALCVSWERSEVRTYRDRLHAMRPLRPVPAEWHAAWNGAPLDLPAGGRIALEPTAPGADAPALSVRYRRGGERIKPAGSGHTRDLRLLLQESGVPPWERDRIPLIHSGAELIAVGDLFISAAGRSICEQRNSRIAWIRAAD